MPRAQSELSVVTRRICLALLAALLFLSGGTACTAQSDTGNADSETKTEQTGSNDTKTESEPTTKPATIEEWDRPRFREQMRKRKAMVKVIQSYGLNNERVLDAMLQVPRHEFVPVGYADSAYNNSPLPIGHGQTISQPYIVAEMTRQLNLTSGSKVLEVGTGSGYQAAVLTEFTQHVYTIEIIEPLAEAASKRLDRLGYDTVEVKHGDGYYGWPEHAPFDAIIVTAAATQIPPPLVEQLKPGGRMMIPVGARFATQSLMLVTKNKEGEVRSESLMPVRFVPLTRDTDAK